MILPICFLVSAGGGPLVRISFSDLCSYQALFKGVAGVGVHFALAPVPFSGNGRSLFPEWP